MRNKKIIYRVAVIILIALSTVIIFAGCGEKSGQLGGTVSDIKMSAAVDNNNRPINPTDVFPSTTPKFYCSFKLSGFPPDSRITAEWIYTSVAKVPSTENISAPTQPMTFTIQQQSGTITSNGYTSVVLEMPTPPGESSDNATAAPNEWYVGSYKVVLSVDGVEKGSKTFEVEEVTSPITD